MHSTYILYSEKLDKYYIGHTSASLDDRLLKHLGEHSGFTSRAKDWKIVFSRSFDTKEEAYAFEREIKKWKSRRAIENLIRS